jgi:type IV pilus assembly protein PilM
MSVLASWLASPPPDAAIEIAADRVAAAALTTRGSGLVVSGHAMESLAPGVVTPSLTATNLHDPAAVAGALRQVIERLGTRVRRVALVVPDTAVKVSLLRFDKVPPRRDDLDQLIRWQLRKAAPFPVDDACVTYAPGVETGDGGREFVVELARREVIREYEAVCEQANVYAGLWTR